MTALRHVYVHVPFCRRRCVYCDFSIAVRRTVPSARYASAVLGELHNRAETAGITAEELETVYFGGGTPSLLDVEALERVLLGIEDWAGGPPTGGVTLEANPEDVTPDRAKAWRAAGITRVSLGVQSFQDSVLSWMHRPHDASAVPAAVDALRSAGIEDLSLDLIIGLPDVAGPNLGEDLERTLALGPDHLSVYTLTVEPRTPLGKWAARGIVDPAPDERHALEFLAVHDVLTAVGFEHYEVSNYALPGRRSMHNAAYWSGRSYLGLGPGAHSFLGSVRSWNLDPWVAYERSAADGKPTTEGQEALSPAQERLERVYLALRTAEGVATDQVAVGSEAATLAAASGWAAFGDGRVRLTPEGWLRLDSLAGALTTEP